MEAVEYLSSLTDKERKKIFSRCDVSMGELYAEGYSYVKDGQLYVCQTVNHAIGDYSVCCLTGFTF